VVHALDLVVANPHVILDRVDRVLERHLVLGSWPVAWCSFMCGGVNGNAAGQWAVASEDRATEYNAGVAVEGFPVSSLRRMQLQRLAR